MKTCSVSGCGRKHHALGFCKLHWARNNRNRDPEEPVKRTRQPGPAPKTCTIAGCGKPHKARGLCDAHDRRNRKYGAPLGGPPAPKKAPPQCVLDGCDRKPVGHGLCGKHYSRLQKYGDPTVAKFEWSDHRREWHVGPQGYVVRYAPESIHAAPNGYEYQHRYVMGEKLGRRLLPTETPHHKNGDRADNRPENLELWVKSQPAGQRVEDLVKWAREILQLYG